MNRDPSNPNLPPWLRDQPLPPRPADAASSGAAPVSGEASVPSWLSSGNDEPSPSATSGDVPDWLRDMGDEPAASSTSASSDVPSWLSGIDDEPAAPSAPATSGDVPSWLSGMGDEPAAPSAPASGDVPDWLRDMGDEPAAPSAPASGDVPSWLSGMDDEPAAPSTSASGDVSSWLSGMDDEPAAPSTSASGDVPSWLSGMDDEPAAPSAPASGDVPSWLSGMDDEPVAPSAPATSGDVPSWLRDMGDEPAAPSAPASGDVPSWLSGMGDEPVAPSTSASGDVPSWLSGMDDEPAAPSTPASGDKSESSFDDWLSDTPSDQIQAAMSEEDISPAVEPFTLEGLDQGRSMPASSGGLPSWLGGAQDDQETASWFGASNEPATPNVPAEDAQPSWLDDDTNTPAAPANPSSDVPAWLQETTQEQPETSSLPAWLQETTQEQPANEPPQQTQNEASGWWSANEPAQSSDSAGSVPSWLEETELPKSNEAVPSWLQPTDLSDDRSAEQPDWMGAGEPSRETTGSTPPAGTDVPEWLREAATTEPPPMETGDDSLPTWLRGEDTASPLPSASPSGEQALPPWLQGAPIDEPAVQQPAEEPTSAGFGSGWFDEPIDTGAAAAETENDFFGKTTLPTWLEEKKPTPKKNEPTALDWLGKIGAPDEEETTPSVMASGPRLTPPASPVKTTSQLQAIALLEQLANDPVSAPPQVEPIPAPSVWQRIGLERALYALLLVALIVTPLVPQLSAPLQVPPNVPGAQRMSDQIAQLGPGDTVLVGYDWDARRVAELRPLENAVLSQLIAQKVKLVLMSTDPQGSLLMYDMRDTLRRSPDYNQYGEGYLLLGYQPGGEIALRTMAQNFGQLLMSDFQGTNVSESALAIGTATGTNRRLTSLTDFSMILLLADDTVDVQSWMEQVQRAAPQVPFATLLTAEAAPAAEPYLQQPNVYGLSGPNGAIAYSALHGDDATVAARSSQFRLGIASFAILLLLGMIGTALARATRRRKA